MNIWILTTWEDSGEKMNEVTCVLFDEKAVLPKVQELLDEYPNITRVTVETWYRDHDEPDASFYESETFWKAIRVEG